MERTNPRQVWQQAAKTGLIGGIAGVLLSLIGMVEAFHQRHVVSEVFTLGQVIFFLVVLFIGYLAARHGARSQPLAALGRGLMAGLIWGAMVALLVVTGHFVNLRAVLVNASPGLYELLTFGQGWQTGSLLLLAAGGVVGSLGAGLYLLPHRMRQAIVIGLTTVIGMGALQELLRPMFAGWGPAAVISDWLFTAKGLTTNSALGLFGLVSVATYLWARYSDVIKSGFGRLPPTGQRALRLSGLLVLLAVLVALPAIVGTFASNALTFVGLYIMMGLGLNIVVGYAGLLDLGYVAFYAIGAYTMGILTSRELGFYSLSFWEALPIAIAMGVLAGIILGVPVLKMRGDYLAIVTLGFGEIVRILVKSDFLRPWLGGAQGLGKIPSAFVLDVALTSPQQLYYLLLIGCLILGFISWRLRGSRLGRAWIAMREDEDVAQAMGINLVATKLLAFATGAAFSALGGAIFAAKLGSVYPHSFDVMVSINVLCLIIVGGMGSIPGVIVGSLFLVGLPELLREFAEYRLLIYGAALVAMMLMRPEGLMPEARRRLELEEFREEEKVSATGLAEGALAWANPQTIPQPDPRSGKGE